MFEDLQQIKRLRRQLGVKQQDLAIAAGVSQSLIAKIEAGTIEPTYSKVRAIFAALDSLRGHQEVSVADFMHKKVLFAKPREKLSEVVALMKKKGISQIPVQGRSGVVGIITESCILDAISTKGVAFGKLKAEEVMEECPPIVSVRTGKKMILELLKEYQLVLVAKKGDIVGLVSKADLLTVI